jgi:hypothetical protein
MCVCSFCYPAWKAHASYCRQWSDRLYNTFTHDLVIGTIFGEQFLNTKFVFRLSLQFLSETFVILKRI